MGKYFKNEKFLAIFPVSSYKEVKRHEKGNFGGKMEKKLFNIFDFQKYEENERISKMIEETEQRFGTDIKVEDLEQVTAAGTYIWPEFDETGY